jgi:hypothetical protein
MAESNGTRMKRIRQIFIDLSLDLSVLVRQIRLMRVPLTRAPELPLLNLGLPGSLECTGFPVSPVADSIPNILCFDLLA